MLRKKDLVKQFELVVKQEIIEHNKAITASNLAMNKHREYVEEELNKLKNNHKLLVNEYSFVSSGFNNFLSDNNSFRDSLSKLDSKCYEVHEKTHKEVKSLDNLANAIHGKYMLLDKSTSDLRLYLSSLEKKLEDIAKKLESESEKTNNKIEKAIKKLKKEILELPSEASEVREELLEILSMNKIDNEGLLREIKVLKKTVFINEKKIENLYTLIERINKKLA